MSGRRTQSNPERHGGADLNRHRPLRLQPARCERRRHRRLLLHPRHPGLRRRQRQQGEDLRRTRRRRLLPGSARRINARPPTSVTAPDQPTPPPPDINTIAGTPVGNVPQTSKQTPSPRTGTITDRRAHRQARRCEVSFPTQGRPLAAMLAALIALAIAADACRSLGGDRLLHDRHLDHKCWRTS